MKNKAYKRINEDLTRVPIVLCGMRGTGKSTSLKDLVKYIKDNSDRIIKVFDVSMSWWHHAPVKHRQLVNAETFKLVQNLGDCVYEMGKLTPASRRKFVARILAEDYIKRYNAYKDDPDYIDNSPRILYIFEEANTYFDSQSLNRKDGEAQIFKDFISIGRNYGLDCVLVATRVHGEVSPGFRNRCAFLIGLVSGEGEVSALSQATDRKTVLLAKKLPLYHFIYYYGSPSEPFHIEDTVKSTPQAIEPKQDAKAKKKVNPKDKLIIFLTFIILGLILSFALFQKPY